MVTGWIIQGNERATQANKTMHTSEVSIRCFQVNRFALSQVLCVKVSLLNKRAPYTLLVAIHHRYCVYLHHLRT